MFGYGIRFDSPAFLALAILIPLLWWWGHRSLSALGPLRRIFVCAFACLIVLLLILAAAELQVVRRNDRLAVVYLVDQSLSIPRASARP